MTVRIVTTPPDTIGVAAYSFLSWSCSLVAVCSICSCRPFTAFTSRSAARRVLSGPMAAFSKSTASAIASSARLLVVVSTCVCMWLSQDWKQHRPDDGTSEQASRPSCCLCQVRSLCNCFLCQAFGSSLYLCVCACCHKTGHSTEHVMSST